MEKLCVLCKHWHIEESDDDYYCPSTPWIECKLGKTFSRGKTYEESTIENPTTSDIRRVAENCDSWEPFKEGL